MEESTLKVIKDKDDYKTKVEIKENAKGEASITVTYRDDDPKVAVEMALKSYNATKDALLLIEKARKDMENKE